MQELGGSEETLINHVAGVPLPATDVFHQITGGGAGMGDPLMRDPERVAADVREGYITRDQARRAYGVLFAEDGSLDLQATERERAQIREQRLGRAPERSPRATDDWVPALVLVEDGAALHCAHCGEDLGSTSDNWRAQAVERRFDAAERLAELEIRVKARENPKIVLYEWTCPGCGTLLETNIYPQEMDPPHDIRVGEVPEPPEGTREI